MTSLRRERSAASQPGRGHRGYGTGRARDRPGRPHRAEAVENYSYAEVKEEAAQVWSDDRIAYTEAKTGVILDLLDAAEVWATANSWTVAQPPR
jgi:hypothetical protein